MLGVASNSVSVPHHLNFLSVCGLEEMFDRAGFIDVVVKTPGQLDVELVVKGARDRNDLQIRLSCRNRGSFRSALTVARRFPSRFLTVERTETFRDGETACEMQGYGELCSVSRKRLSRPWKWMMTSGFWSFRLGQPGRCGTAAGCATVGVRDTTLAVGGGAGVRWIQGRSKSTWKLTRRGCRVGLMV